MVPCAMRMRVNAVDYTMNQAMASIRVRLMQYVLINRLHF